jgi:hypothetical protein
MLSKQFQTFVGDDSGINALHFSSERSAAWRMTSSYRHPG